MSSLSDICLDVLKKKNPSAFIHPYVCSQFFIYLMKPKMEARFEDFSSQILLKTKCVHVCLAIFYISYSLQCDKVKEDYGFKKKYIYVYYL